MEDRINWIDHYLEPYAEDDTLLNDWIKDIIRSIQWRLFENQEQWLYMVGEAPDTTLPKFRDNAREYMRRVAYGELGYLVDYIIDYLVTKYRLSNIELDEETVEDIKWELQDIDGGYEAWEAEARRRIIEEYTEAIGEEKTNRLVKEWWGEQ